MRLTILILLTVILLVSASSYAQKITLTEKNTPLATVIDNIRRQSGVDFVFTTSTIKNAKPVNISVKNTELKDVLKQIFSEQPLAYSIEDKSVIISLKEKSFLDKIVSVFAAIEVKGKVIDANGKPIVRANIRVKNKSIFGFTNEYGEYDINGVDDRDILIISYLGYETKEIPASRVFTTTQLIEATSKLEEVIISTGYQKVNKDQMAGAISSVKAEDLPINGVNTIEQLLQGKLSGVDVTSSSGDVGTKQKIRVRGTSTLLGNQDPVWVVDGIIQEDPLPFKATEINNFNSGTSTSDGLKQFIGSAISWLNPYDIEDVTVLKDASSTAIYGVKAANGVILINTKRGKLNTPANISYNTSFSFANKITYDKLNLMNSKERVDVSREIYERGLLSTTAMGDVGYQGLLKQYLSNKLSYDQFNTGVKQLEVNNTNWLDILTQTALSQNHNVSISGGGTNSTYYGSFGYTDKVGQSKGNAQNGYKGSAGFTANINSKLSVNFRFAGSYDTTDGFFPGIDPYGYATNTSRVLTAYNSDGSLSYHLKDNYKFNILNEIANSGNENIKSSFNTNIGIKYILPKGFSYDALFGAQITNTNAQSYASAQTQYITKLRGYEYGTASPTSTAYINSTLPYGGILNEEDTRNFNYTFRNNISYQHLFDGKHSVSGMAGIEFRSNKYDGTSGTYYGYLPDRGKTVVTPPLTYTTSNTVNSKATSQLTIKDVTSNYVSYYLTGAYSYDKRYVLNVSVRGDASNSFGQDTRSRFAPIWALGARWNAAREKWFDKTAWISDFSIRATYGYQANVAENFGPDLVAYIPTPSINTYTGEPILKIQTLPYTDLRKEKTQTTNLGLDFSFFNNRVFASIDYYTKRSKDLIVYKNIPYEYGIAQMPVNGGTMYNNGLDLSINFVPIRNKNLTWSLAFNTGYNHNKITSTLLPNASWYNAASGTYNVEGYATSSFWVFNYTGPSATNGIPTFNIPVAQANKNDATSYMSYGGKLNADFTGGLGTNIRYKQFTLSTNLYASLGGKKILANLYNLDMQSSSPNEYNNLSADLVNRWRKPGDEAFTQIPSLPFATAPSYSVKLPGEVTSYSPYALYNYSNARVVNASYLKMNNIDLRYKLPDRFSKKIGSKNVSIGYSMTNVFKWVSEDFKGIDPEVASGNTPLPRSNVFSLSALF